MWTQRRKSCARVSRRIGERHDDILVQPVLLLSKYGLITTFPHRTELLPGSPRLGPSTMFELVHHQFAQFLKGFRRETFTCLQTFRSPSVRAELGANRCVSGGDACSAHRIRPINTSVALGTSAFCSRTLFLQTSFTILLSFT